MKLDTFFDKFELFADAPNAVQKMRELILIYAVQGKLVLQELGEASALQELAEIDFCAFEFEARFEIPANWVWAPLEALLLVMKNGFNGTPNKLGGKYKVTRIETIARGSIDMSRVGFADELPAEVLEKHLIKKGDILFSHINSEPHLGKTAICTFDDTLLIHGVNLLLLRSKPQIDPHYLNTTFKELRSAGYFVSIAQRAINQSSINQKNLGKTLIPVPPLAEQKRIVAKVDELMALCDRLEAQQQQRAEKYSVLARAAVSRFADAPTPANLDFIFHNAYAITPADLRKTILTLAVQGKLVPQDPNDESVPVIGDFRRNIAGLMDSLGLRAQKELDGISNPLFDIPEHWRWMVLNDIGAAQTGSTPSKTDHRAFNGDIPFIKPADILSQTINYKNESLTRYGAESGSRLAPKGSLLMVCIGTIGKCNLIDRECAFNQQINALTPVSAVDPRYLLVAVRSRSFQEVAWEKSSSTTIAILNKGKWLSIPIPVPPLAEQKRIVAKVDELMKLVDQLESQLAASSQQAEQLMNAIVAELTAA